MKWWQSSSREKGKEDRYDISKEDRYDISKEHEFDGTWELEERWAFKYSAEVAFWYPMDCKCKFYFLFYTEIFKIW